MHLCYSHAILWTPAVSLSCNQNVARAFPEAFRIGTLRGPVHIPAPFASCVFEGFLYFVDVYWTDLYVLDDFPVNYWTTIVPCKLQWFCFVCYCFAIDQFARTQ
jgi:hypothetical protein